MRFEVATANRIVFGPGTLSEAAPAARAFGQPGDGMSPVRHPSGTRPAGQRALVVVGKSAGRAEKLLEQLKTEGLTASIFHVPGEPTIEMVVAGTQQARAAGCEVVIGLGGGSALDTGKAIAALLTNPGDIYDYLEVVGKGQALVNTPAAFIAIPTTSGTGSEVTRNSVLTAPEARVKVSLRSALMLPRLAIVDPELTYGLPPDVTAASGMDALTQLLEPFLSNAANPISDGFSREGLARIARALRLAYADDDHQAREDMALASLLGGLALANARLGAVHAFAGPIGGMFPAPHGALCARLLPVIMEINLKALNEREPLSPQLERFAEAARILTGNPGARAEDGIGWIKELCETFKISPLAAYGIKASDFPAITAQAKKANSMKGNPVALTDGELNGILETAL